MQRNTSSSTDPPVTGEVVLGVVTACQYPDPKDVQQQALDLEFEPNTDPLRRMLLEFIVGRPGGRMVEDLQQYTLFETVYRPAQVISLVEKMRDGKVVATEQRRVTKKTSVFPYAEKPGQGELFRADTSRWRVPQLELCARRRRQPCGH